jgi:activator of 2-hydroxyglutaryl-CoA dehydratase
MTTDTTAVRYAGIDIGSRTIKLVVVDGTGAVLETCRADTGFDPMATANALIEKVSFDKIMATGYGRNLFELSFDAPTVTEIKAHARGEDRKEIARGLHTSVIRRAAGMINRVSSDGPIVFTGGVAKNPCMVELLSQKLDRKIRIPSDPQLAGAYGAALLAQNSGRSRN